MSDLKDEIRQSVTRSLLKDSWILYAPIITFLGGLILSFYDLSKDISTFLDNAKSNPAITVSIWNFIPNLISILMLALGIFTYLYYIFKALDSLKKHQTELITSNDKIISQLKNISLWSSETIEKVNVFIYNMYNFLIHAPVYLAKEHNYFDKELIETKFFNKANDIEAIKAIKNGQGIAITDPCYLREFDDENDLIILSPIIVKPAIWVLQKEINSSASYKPKIFVYDKNSTAWKIGKKHLKSIKNIDVTDLEENGNIKTLNNFFDDFRNDTSFKEALVKINNCNEILKNLENPKDDMVFKTFLLINYLLALDSSSTSNQNIIKIIITYLNNFDFLFLTEPEATFIYEKLNELVKENFANLTVNPFAKIYIDLKDPDKNINGDYLFTAVITTKTYIKNNPIAILKFLKGLKLGLLKTQYLNIGDIISRTLSTTIGSDGHNLMFQEIEALKEKIEINNVKNFYPKDLILFINETQKGNTSNSAIINTTFNYYVEGINKFDFNKYILSDNEQDTELKNIILFLNERLKYNDYPI
ncbi:MAG: hypothetical protein M0P66_09790 [Salinivirgaceae bacterium]|nr:hypothetical protein [Salinivirgaceae bacterium]